MWELDRKEGWVPKNRCCWTVVLKKTLKSPLDFKEFKQVNPKANQSWISIGRTDAEAEAPILGPLMGRFNPLEKALMLGKTEGKRRRGQERMRWLESVTKSTDMNLGVSKRQWRTEEPGMLQPMGSQRVRHNLATEQQQYMKKITNKNLPQRTLLNTL